MRRDNAPAVRVFRSFKTEWMAKNGYQDINQAKKAISAYISEYNKSVRPHRFNDNLTPLAKERLYYKKTS